MDKCTSSPSIGVQVQRLGTNDAHNDAIVRLGASRSHDNRKEDKNVSRGSTVRQGLQLGV
jgi:hypothetical protein